MGVFGLDSSPAIEASSGFLDGVLDYLKEFAGGILENVVGHGIWDLINGVFRPKKSVWEEHRMTIIVALVGAAILIGMILYDPRQKNLPHSMKPPILLFCKGLLVVEKPR